MSQQAIQVAFPLAEKEEWHKFLTHAANGTTYNANISPDRATTPEQEMWAQMIWYAVYESTGAGRGKNPCDECHGDYFDENPEHLVDRGRKGKVKPHCHPGCPCGHFGVTFQQCAINFLNGPELEVYLELAGNLNPDYLRRLIANGGAKNTIHTGQLHRADPKIVDRKRRTVRNGNKIHV